MICRLGPDSGERPSSSKIVTLRMRRSPSLCITVAISVASSKLEAGNELRWRAGFPAVATESSPFPGALVAFAVAPCRRARGFRALVG